MKNISEILFLGFLIALTSCSTSRNSTLGMPNEPGKCYAKCLMPEEYGTHVKEYIVYTGDASTEAVDIETIEEIIQPAATKWVKKKADRNCLSADPNDCLVWCLVTEPEIKETYTILLDTTQSKNYEIVRQETRYRSRPGGFTEWREVVCENDITDSLIEQVERNLQEKRYLESRDKAKLDSKLKNALKEYQKDHGLPLGQLDTETLDALGVVY